MTVTSARDALWFKDAIIYEVHVRAFFDSNGDGIGDFPGLLQKLDYIQGLGVNCIWLLPFYPSPLRDDGYDIANYRDVHPAYGTLRDFRHFLREAHRRNIRVFTELVVNHTSDQHPWFQAARRAAPRSAKRDYYVWSDSGTEYADARVIFTDTETSNWTWDPVAKAYYWHRFFSHQPDLNFDNPHVRRAVIKTMQFWLDMGVDGLRLDAVPYLVEREGTNCENLPETHAILRDLRRELESRYPDRALLAEANQWPADVRPYFGDGDQCHLAYHFPLMPRIFMAVRQEDAHPIVEILRQTPEIPDACQWALFLRNHDELTLEMVTDEERDYMYSSYAADPHMRLNVGIRRRLAPMMDYSRRRMELLNSLLLALPGSPIVYYGDEIGMGDNVYLGDRNGVRTPMQWTGDRNAGFSRADPARLFAPPVMDPLFGYQAINVEAQERSPASFLNWTRRMIALRKRYRTFGRGSLEFIGGDNRRVLSFVREYEDEQILVVANLARSVQPVHLDLQRYRGRRPVEMIGNTDMPAVGTAPYFLTLGPHGFYWFVLQRAAEPVAVRETPAERDARLPTLLVSAQWEAIFDKHSRHVLERDALKPFLLRQRWFAGKARDITAARIADWTTVRNGMHPLFVTIVDVSFGDGGADERYLLPVGTASGAEAQAVGERTPAAVIARLSGARSGVLFDALTVPTTGHVLFDLLRHGQAVPLHKGVMRPGFVEGAMSSLVADAEGLEAHVPSLEQSNSNVLLGDKYLLKVFRRLHEGENPDIEIGRALAAAGSRARVPALSAWADYQAEADGPRASLLMVQQQVAARGAAWERAIDQLQQYFEQAQVAMRSGRAIPAEVGPRHVLVEELVGAYWTSLFLLGRRTAELHAAMAELEGDGFGYVPLEAAELARLSREMQGQASRTLDLLENQLAGLDAARQAKARRILELRGDAMRRFEEVATIEGAGQRIRTHGDFHLGQVLEVDGDLYIIDFEGEPTRPIAERRALKSPLRDIAGMLRSFGYAAHAGLRLFLRTQPDAARALGPWAAAWEEVMGRIYERAYLATLEGAGLLPATAAARTVVLDAFILEKSFYELTYELNSRPDWVGIPLDGLLRVLDPAWEPRDDTVPANTVPANGPGDG